MASAAVTKEWDQGTKKKKKKKFHRQDPQNPSTMASAAATKEWDQVISDGDIIDIVDISNLTHLDDIFINLEEVRRIDITNAQQQDPKKWANIILYLWYNRNSLSATRGAFITAAEKVQDYTATLDQLKRKWNIGTKKKKKKKFHRQGEPCASIGYDLPGSSTDTGSGSRMTIDFDETSSKRGVTVSSNQEHGLHAASQVNDQSIPSKAMVDEPLQGTKKKKKRKSHLRENEQETDRLHQLNPSSTKVKKKERQTDEVQWPFPKGGEKHKRLGHIVINNVTKDIKLKPCYMPRDNNHKRGRPLADLDFKSLTYKVMECFEGNPALFRKAKWLFSPDVPYEKTETMSAPRFVEFLQEPEYQKLDPLNLDDLYRVMDHLKESDIVEEIDNYRGKHANDSLPIWKSHRTNAMDTFVFEVVLARDITEYSVNDVNKHKNNLHASTGVPKSKIQCIGIGCGCTVLVFQLPLRWPEDQSGGGAKIDVRGRMNNYKIQKANWLMDSDVIGIHIEGQDYIDLTGISSKGSEKMELTSDKEEQEQSITMMEDMTLEEKKLPSDEQDEAMVSEVDILDIVETFQLSDLNDVYTRLGLADRIVENVKLSDTRSPKKQAMYILNLWRNRNGADATRSAILAAMEECQDCRASVNTLKEKWTLGIKMMEDMTLEERKLPSDEQDEASLEKMELTPDKEEQEQSDSESFPEILTPFRDQLMEYYQVKMGHLPLLPWLEEPEMKHMDDVFVDLELVTKGRGVMRPVKLAHIEDLVTLRHPYKQEKYATRILVLGEAGSGKTNLMSKIAYSWSQQNHPSLNQFELVFYLRMRFLHSCNDASHCLRRGRGDFGVPHEDCDLIHEILQQMPETSVNVHALHRYMQLTPDKILILLDGWDESVLDHVDLEKTNMRVGNHDIENILSCKKHISSCVIVTSRPYKSIGKMQSKYVTVLQKGFSHQNVHEYIWNFFQGEAHGSAKTLVSYLETSDTLLNLVRSPVMLMLMCWLWREKMTFDSPMKLTDLYYQLVCAMWDRYCARSISDEMLESDKSMALQTLGKVALQGILEERLIFRKHDIGIDSDIGVQLGLLISERTQSGLRVAEYISFLHVSFQQFCAAYLLAHNPDQLTTFLESLDTWSKVLSEQKVLFFCCGLCSKMLGHDVATNIIKHAVACFVKDGWENHYLEISVGNNHATTCNILPVLEMINESGQTSHNALMKPIADLIYADKLRVHCTLPQTLAVFHQFVCSEFGHSLFNIHAIRFDHHPLSALDVISDTLRCMPRVHHITLNFMDSTDVASETSMTQLGESIAALSKLSALSVRHAHNGLDIDVIFHHLSQSSKIFKSLHVEDTHIGDAISYMGGIIPHLESLTLRDVAFQDRHITALCDILPNATCLSELVLLGNPIGNDALHVLFTHIHRLVRLQLLVISAIVDCHCSPLVKECLMVAGKDDIPVEACAISLLYEGDVIQSLLSISRNAATSLDSPKQTQS